MMVIYVIFGGVIGLLSVLSLLAAREARSVAARLEESVAEVGRAAAKQSLELQTEMRSLADLHQQEFSRVRALLEVVPHSIAALKPELAEIRAHLPQPKPAYEDPVPSIEARSETDILRIAAALAIVRPLTPYPNWYFDKDWQNPDLSYRIRRSIWTYFSRRKTTAALDIPWYGDLKLRIYLGNDLSRQQFVAGCLDPNEFALLDKLLSPGMVFLDVGANEGFYTVFASHRVGNSGSVWAFEPSRRELEHLTANVQLNNPGNVRSFCMALADEDSHAELLVAGDEHSGHNTLGQFVYESGLLRRESVPVRRLDSLLLENSLARLDFLKIDVEGAEMRVLAGALGALRRFRPMMLLEVSDPSLKAQGSSRDELIAFLESQAYRLYLFDPSTGVPVPAFEGRYGANMLAIPVERNLPEPALLPLPVPRG
jgi:FkbM family methyltransferase